jgi:hypothetical protein
MDVMPSQAAAGFGFSGMGGPLLPPQAAANGMGRMPMPPQAQAGSPDGLGGHIQYEPYERDLPMAPTTRYHTQELGYELPFEPKDTTTSAAIQSAGFTALLVAVSVGLGVAAGGPYGAGAGLMLAGAVANGYRAQKWMNEADPGKKNEAVVSATFAVGEIVLGSYLAYKAYKEKQKG